MPKEAVIRPGVDPPSGKVLHIQPPDEAPSTMLWLKNETAISNKEKSTLQYSPIAKAAPALPDCLPILSMQAAHSHSEKNKLKPPLLMVTGQHRPIREVFSPIPTARNNTCLIMNLGACQSALNGNVDRPGVILPFCSKSWPMTNMPPIHMEVLLPMRQPRDKVDVSKKKTGMPLHPPMLPKPSAPIISRRSITPRLQVGGHKPLIEVVTA